MAKCWYVLWYGICIVMISTILGRRHSNSTKSQHASEWDIIAVLCFDERGLVFVNYADAVDDICHDNELIYQVLIYQELMIAWDFQ